MTNYNKIEKKSEENVVEVEDTQPVVEETPVEVKPVSTNKKTGRTKSYLNVRSTMSTDSDIVEVLPVDTEINILGSEGEWYQISHGDKFGYVLSKFVEMEN